MTAKQTTRPNLPCVYRSSLFGYQSRTYRALIALATTTLVSGVAHAAEVPQSLQEVTARAMITTPEQSEASVAEKEVRLKAMREAAQSYGARAGLIHRTHEKRSELDRAGKYLDAIWNFQPLMLPNAGNKSREKLQARDILPPVIVAEDASFKQDSDTIIHKGGPNYHILSQARFVATPPTWRNYLYTPISEEPPTLPPSALRPRNESEQRDFSRWVKEGWSAGEAQADRIYTTALNRITRDYVGMWTYYELLRDKVVSLPFVASSNPGVSGDAENLNINDVTLNITVMPQFRLDSTKWSPGGKE